MEDLTLTTIADLAGQIALSVALLWLLVSEKREHRETRQQYRADLLKVINEMQDLLKEIAGIKANMWNVQRLSRNGDTRPLPEIDS